MRREYHSMAWGLVGGAALYLVSVFFAFYAFLAYNAWRYAHGAAQMDVTVKAVEWKRRMGLLDRMIAQAHYRVEENLAEIHYERKRRRR